MDNCNEAEQARRRVLAKMEILDSAPEREFEAVVVSARRIFDCKTSYVSLIDVDRQWFKARRGFEPQEVPRDCSICAIAVEECQEIVVADLQAHPVFGEMPDIKAAPDLRFFATIPLFAAGGGDPDKVTIGTLCVIDDAPRHADESKLDELRDLAHVVEALFQTRLAAKLADLALRERMDLIDDLSRTHRQFELAEKMANIGSWRLDLETNKVEWSKQTQAIHAVDHVSGHILANAIDYYIGADRERIATAVEQCIAHGTPYDLEADFRNALGEQRRVRAIGELEMHNGKGIALIGVFQDITDRYRLETRLRKAANTDDLTGLANRARLNAYLEDAICSATRTNQRLALALIDLDNFKQANDRLGHEAGDHVLRLMAEKLRLPPFASHLSARLGGDEMVLVIEEGPLLQDLDRTLSALLRSLRCDLSNEEESLEVTATIGAAWLTPENADRGALLRCADHALYHAKSVKRGSAAIYSEERPARPNLLHAHLRALG